MTDNGAYSIQLTSYTYNKQFDLKRYRNVRAPKHKSLAPNLAAVVAHRLTYIEDATFPVSAVFERSLSTFQPRIMSGTDIAAELSVRTTQRRP